MSGPQPSSPDFDQHMLSFAELPHRYRCLAEGHALQDAVRACAAQCLQIYTSSAASAPSASQLPARAGPGPTQPSRRLKPRRRHTAACRHRNRHASPPASPPSPPPPAAFFACPFYKLNPRRHHACAWTVALPSVRAAKQHVIVHHHAPIHCPVCAAHFPSAVARDQHVRARQCAKREPTPGLLEGATESQVDRLLRRDVVPPLLPPLSRRRARRCRCRHDEEEEEEEEDGEESWFRMWDVLFPDEARPETGYLAAPAEREVVALRRFWKTVGPRVVRRLLLGPGRGADLETREAVAGSVLRDMVEQAGLAGGRGC